MKLELRTQVKYLVYNSPAINHGAITQSRTFYTHFSILDLSFSFWSSYSEESNDFQISPH